MLQKEIKGLQHKLENITSHLFDCNTFFLRQVKMQLENKVLDKEDRAQLDTINYILSMYDKLKELETLSNDRGDIYDGE